MSEFQFHKGTIRTLKLVNFCNFFIKFQFHKGTIRTKLGRRQAGLSTAFQFHKGTIRTHYRVRIPASLNNFNSIKVRLEPHCF